MIPEDVVAAAGDLHAKRLFPVHWSKFSLALHPWDDSITRVLKQAKISNIPVLHPMIGEVVCLKNPTANIEWWKQMN
jgi:L-ascorbate metabolism protein UlaG (beta-lactamase superfamily)